LQRARHAAHAGAERAAGRARARTLEEQRRRRVVLARRRERQRVGRDRRAAGGRELRAVRGPRAEVVATLAERRRRVVAGAGEDPALPREAERRERRRARVRRELEAVERGEATTARD